MSEVALVLFIIFAVYSFFSLGAIFLLALSLDNLKDRHASAHPVKDERPLVSIIIPCRNEAQDISACIDSILNQDYGNIQVIAVDGNSTDGTWERLKSYGDRIIQLKEQEAPEGWTGKNWGAYSGYLESKGEYILFTDADMVFSMELVRFAVETIRNEDVGMLTLGPEMKMKSFWERAVLPLFAQVVMLLFLPQLMNRDISRRSMANGQFMLTRRDSYERACTHKGISGSIVEDVALARAFRANGMKVRFYWAGEMLRTRMYTSLGEMKEGIVRDIQASLGREYEYYLLDAIYLALTFFSPFVMLAYAVSVHQLPLLTIALISLIFVILRMLIFQVGTQSPKWYSLIFAVPVAFYLYTVCSAMARAVTGKPVTWKGRHYRTPER